jgi:hypothetical protein
MINTKRLRLTFDMQLKTTPYFQGAIFAADNYSSFLYDSAGNELIILEVKYDQEQLPSAITSILQKVNATLSSFSKYGSSINYLLEQKQLLSFKELQL